jgi:hypothetical protein
MLDDIKQLLAQGEAERALRLLRPLAAQQPRSAEVQLCLSEAYFQLGAGPRAVATAREAVRLARRDPATHYQLGRILSAQGQWTAAETALQQALQLSPGYALAQAELDRVRRALGQGGTPAATRPPSSPALSGEGEPRPARPDPARPASSPRPWGLALMSTFVLLCCAAIVFATLQPRWTGEHRHQGPKPQATTLPQPPTPRAPSSLPTSPAAPPQATVPATPIPAESTARPNPVPPMTQGAQTPTRSQGTAAPRPSAGPHSTDPGPGAGQPGEEKGGTGGLLVECPLCRGSGWMICPYCLLSGDPKCEMCGGRREVICWFCGGKGQARRLPSGEIVDTVGDRMPTETIPNAAIRQAVERYRKTGEMPPELRAEVEKFLKQFRPGGGDAPTPRPPGP